MINENILQFLAEEMENLSLFPFSTDGVLRVSYTPLARRPHCRAFGINYWYRAEDVVYLSQYLAKAAHCLT